MHAGCCLRWRRQSRRHAVPQHLRLHKVPATYMLQSASRAPPGRILATLGMNTVLLTAAASLGVRIWAYAVRHWERLLDVDCVQWGKRAAVPNPCELIGPLIGPCLAVPAPSQLLPRIGLHWVVVIEGLHAITYACGWSGGQGRVGSMQGGGHNAACKAGPFSRPVHPHGPPTSTSLPLSLQPRQSTAARSLHRAWRAPHRWSCGMDQSVGGTHR